MASFEVADESCHRCLVLVPRAFLEDWLNAAIDFYLKAYVPALPALS